MKALLFIPAYNCENQISRVINQIYQIPQMSIIDTVLIVNNRSLDNTEKVAIDKLKSTKTNLRKVIVRNKENYGLGGSHKVAIKIAQENKFSHLIVLHGDDQGNIKDMLPYLKEANDYDCILGARFHLNSEIHGYSTFRIFGNKVFNLLFSFVTRCRLLDLGSGLNLYNLKIFEDNFHIKFPDNLTFNYCNLLGHCYLKHEFKFIPISWREDDQLSNVKLFRQAWQILTYLFKFWVSSKTFLQKEHRTQIYDYSYEIIYSS